MFDRPLNNRPTGITPDGRRYLTRSFIPDPDCIEAGDRLLTDSVRAFAAAGFSDDQIEDRVLAFVGWTVLVEPDPRFSDTTLTGYAGRDPDPALAQWATTFDPPPEPPDADRWRAERAAVALARWCAGIRLPAARIVALLASLAPEHRSWPNDDQLIAIARAAIAEMSA